MAIVLIASVLLNPAETGATATIVVAGVIWAFGGLQLWLAERTPPTVRYPSRFVDPDTLPLPDRTRFFRRQLVSCLIVFPVLSAWIAYDLNRLESGAADHVDVWLPLALIYQHLGYWPAVLAAPALGITFAITFIVKLRRIERLPEDIRSGDN